MFEQILQQIQAFDRVIIHRHSKPDGDAMGSQIGLKHLLLVNFPNKEIYAVGDHANRFAFMEDSVMDEIPDDRYRGALAVILDCGAPQLVSDCRYKLADRTARIDHHIFSGQFADIEVIDTGFESCAGMVTAFAMECGLRLSKIAAQSLYTGIVTDSGRFRYDATTARTFHQAAFLMEQPIDINSIYQNLYAENLETKQLRAQFITNIQLTKNRVAYIYTTLEQAEAMQIDTFTISRGMVNTMADIAGVSIWVNFTETNAGVLCELRSNQYNINPIAVKYGGGGHQKASGATVPDYETAMKMLSDLDDLQGENHE